MVQGHTVRVPADPTTMNRIANQTGGRSFNAQSSGELQVIYDQIGKAIGYDTRQHEIGVWFTIAALALAALAALAARIWTERLL